MNAFSNNLYLLFFAAVVPFFTLCYTVVSMHRMRQKVGDEKLIIAQPPVIVHYYYTRNTRALCWVNATMIFGWGIALAASGETLDRFPAYAILAERAPQHLWSVFLITVGVVRYGALLINGLSGSSPLIRCAASFIGCLVWSQFLASLASYSVQVGSLSPGVTIYVVLLFSDMYSCGLSMRDWMRTR